jgi:hypothetical protein
MKSLIAALVTICLLAAPVLAWSNVRMEYHGTGTSYLNEYSDIWGSDWSEGAATTDPSDYNPNGPTDVMTAFIHEVVINVGNIDMAKEVRSTGAWELNEDKQASGTGFTNIRKDVVWWTEDKKVCDDENGCYDYENNYVEYGKLFYPTEANIYTAFSTEFFSDVEEIHNVANNPPANDISATYPQVGLVNSLSKGWTTNDPFLFTESVGINKDLRCTLELPRLIRPPSCLGCQD